MKTLYKSSFLQTYMYYFLYSIIICICIFFICRIISYGDFGIFNICIITIFVYGLIESTESLLALRYIEVTEENIVVRLISGTKKIDYKNILYVYNLINSRGKYLIIWYKDLNNKDKVILARPESKPGEEILNPLKVNNFTDLEITNYIKSRAVKENPNYLNINNKRWFLFSISPTFKI